MPFEHCHWLPSGTSRANLCFSCLSYPWRYSNGSCQEQTSHQSPQQAVNQLLFLCVPWNKGARDGLEHSGRWGISGRGSGTPASKHLVPFWALDQKAVISYHRFPSCPHVVTCGNCSFSRDFNWRQLSQSRPVLSNSLQAHGLYSLWNSLGWNTWVGSLSLLQGIFPTKVSHTAGGFFTSWVTKEALRRLWRR